MEKKIDRHYRLSQTCIEMIQTIKEDCGLKSDAIAIEFVVQFYLRNETGIQELLEATKEQLHESRLIKKYLNQIRRDDYMMLDLLNAQCIQQGTLEAPPHHLIRSQSNAYVRAKENLTAFLNEVATKNTYGQNKVEGEETDGRTQSWRDFEDEVC